MSQFENNWDTRFAGYEAIRNAFLSVLRVSSDPEQRRRGEGG